MVKEVDRSGGITRPLAEESHDDYRQRLAAARAEAMQRREHELSEQSSPANSAADRIRIWERRHQLQLPERHDHMLLPAIAVNTGLTLEDVRAEQRQRLAARSGTRKD